MQFRHLTHLQVFGSAKLDDASVEWGQQRMVLEGYLSEGTEEGLMKAIRVFCESARTLMIIDN